MPNNRDRLIKSNYKEFDTDKLLAELSKAVIATNSLEGIGVEDFVSQVKEINGIVILQEELISRGITPPSTLFG